MCTSASNWSASRASKECERLGHVAVAEVAALAAAVEDGAIVRLRVRDQARVLLGVELEVLGEPAVAAGELGCAVVQLEELLDRLPLARFRAAEGRLVRVD